MKKLPSSKSSRHVAAVGPKGWSMHLRLAFLSTTAAIVTLSSPIVLLLSAAASGANAHSTATEGNEHDDHHHHFLHQHECIHDSPELQESFRRDFHIVHQKYKVMGRRNRNRNGKQKSDESNANDDGDDNTNEDDSIGGPFSAQASVMSSNMRIVVSSLDLDDSSKFCTAVGQTDRPNFLGGNSAACKAEEILTAAKKAVLLENIIPAATKLLSELLLVNPVSGNLLIGSGCGSISTPPSHISDGVPNADFVLYVSAAPTTGSTVAWASTCGSDSQGRPIFGKANFSPLYLDDWEAGKTVKESRQNNMMVRTAVHEILHALGFSSGLWQSLELIQGKVLKGKETRRGAERTIIVSPSAVAAAQNFFACESLTGPEIEDEGGSGTAGSHWERRTHYDDVMSGVVGDKMFLSPVTTGLLSDLGFYGIADSKVETPMWMKDLGCGAHTEKCNTAAGGGTVGSTEGRYFCAPTSPEQCSYDFIGYGKCYVGTLTTAIPSYEQYFSDPAKGGTDSLLNYCPVTRPYSNRVCDDSTSSSNPAQDVLYGEYFGKDSMCFKTDPSVLKKGVSTSGTPASARCMRKRCLVNGADQILEIAFAYAATVNESAINWIRCPNSLSKSVSNNFGYTAISLDPYGYVGSVYCPNNIEPYCPPIDLSGNNATAPPAATVPPTTTPFDPNATVSPSTAPPTTEESETDTTEAPITTPTPTAVVSPTIPKYPSPFLLRPLSAVHHVVELTLVGSRITQMLVPATGIFSVGGGGSAAADPSGGGETGGTDITTTTATTTTITTTAASAAAHHFEGAASTNSTLTSSSSLLTATASATTASFTSDITTDFKLAVAADIEQAINLSNETGIGVLVDRYVATVVTFPNGSQTEGIIVRALISTPVRATGFLTTLWLYQMNQTSVDQPAAWMKFTQALYRKVLGTSNAASSSSAWTPMGDQFSVMNPSVTDPTKSTDFLTDCGPLGCVATVAVATIGGWVLILIVCIFAYQMMVMLCGFGVPDYSQYYLDEETRKREKALRKAERERRRRERAEAAAENNNNGGEPFDSIGGGGGASSRGIGGSQKPSPLNNDNNSNDPYNYDYGGGGVPDGYVPTYSDYNTHAGLPAKFNRRSTSSRNSPQPQPASHGHSPPPTQQQQFAENEQRPFGSSMSPPPNPTSAAVVNIPPRSYPYE